MTNFLILIFILLAGESLAQAAPAEVLPPVEIHCALKSTADPAASIRVECEPDQETHAISNSSAPAAEVSPIRASPFSIVLQTGAYAGLISPGINFRFFRRNEITLLGGYVPRVVDGARIWEANLKYQIEPFNDLQIHLRNGEKIAINPIHLGFGAIFGFHKDLFFKLPSQYPASYYSQTARRYTFNIGTSVSYRRVTLYVDYSGLDVGMIAYFWDKNGKFFRDNYPVFGLAGIGTMGFGVKYNLRKAANFKSEGKSR